MTPTQELHPNTDLAFAALCRCLLQDHFWTPEEWEAEASAMAPEQVSADLYEMAKDGKDETMHLAKTYWHGDVLADFVLWDE